MGYGNFRLSFVEYLNKQNWPHVALSSSMSCHSALSSDDVFLAICSFSDSFPNLKKIYQYYVERVDLQFMWNDHLKEIKVMLNILFGKGPVESIMVLSLAILCTKAPSENWFKIRKTIAKLMISKGTSSCIVIEKRITRRDVLQTECSVFFCVFIIFGDSWKPFFF